MSKTYECYRCNTKMEEEEAREYLWCKVCRDTIEIEILCYFCKKTSMIRVYYMKDPCPKCGKRWQWPE